MYFCNETNAVDRMINLFENFEPRPIKMMHTATVAEISTGLRNSECEPIPIHYLDGTNRGASPYNQDSSPWMKGEGGDNEHGESVGDCNCGNDNDTDDEDDNNKLTKNSIAWEMKRQELLKYKAMYGDTNVRQGRQCANKTLATWVRNQRMQYRRLRGKKQSSMTMYRIKKLEQLGFQWGNARWEDRYVQLIKYKKVNSNTNVPQLCNHIGYDTTPGVGGQQQSSLSATNAHVASARREHIKLASWVKTQKAQYKLYKSGKKSSLNEDRVRKLIAIGFEWQSPKTVKKQHQELQQEQQKQYDQDQGPYHEKQQSRRTPSQVEHPPNTNVSCNTSATTAIVTMPSDDARLTGSTVAAAAPTATMVSLFQEEISPLKVLLDNYKATNSMSNLRTNRIPPTSSVRTTSYFNTTAHPSSNNLLLASNKQQNRYNTDDEDMFDEDFLLMPLIQEEEDVGNDDNNTTVATNNNGRIVSFSSFSNIDRNASAFWNGANNAASTTSITSSSNARSNANHGHHGYSNEPITQSLFRL